MATPLNNVKECVAPENPESAACHLRKQFSITQWYYQSLWWQQYLYWQGFISSQQPRVPTRVPTYNNPLIYPNTPNGGQSMGTVQHTQIQIRIVNG